MRNDHHRPGTLALALSTAALALGITGCSVSPATSAATSSQLISGRVHGGNQPVTGSTIQVYAPGTNGYGSASFPLLSPAVTTDASGGFSLSGFTCPSAATPVYIVATGGNPGLAAGTNNSALALMALLGPCGNLSSGTFIDIGELTTVAAVWSLAPFMTDYAHIGTSPGNVQGMVNAFNTAQSLVNISNDSAPGTAPSIAAIPVAQINTIGSIISTCINSDGSTLATSGCGKLFTAATAAVGVAPSDTISAALNMARNPARNVGAIFSSLPPSGPFQPVLTVAPSDWTIAINYVSPTFFIPSDLAIDSQGNAWVVSTPSGGVPTSTVSILNATSGIAASYVQSSINLSHIALDPHDDPWLSSTVSSSVIELTGSGTQAGNPFTGGGIQGPGALAFDGQGNLWIANNGPTVSKLGPSGTALSPGTGYSTNGSGGAAALALDTAGNAWIADTNGNDVAVLSSSGAPIPGSPYIGGSLSFPYSVAIDSSGGAWVANLFGNSVSRFSSDGTAIAGSPFSGAGLNQPIDLALDGLDNVWVANSGGNSVSELLSTGSPQSGTAGYASSTLASPFRVAIDKSGNVWVANTGAATPGTGVITQIVGAAAPVVTPKSVAIQTNALDQRP